jgi:hypothetical protein
VSAAAASVPDLLRRFVDAPYRATVQIGSIEVVLQTNEADLATALQRVSATQSTENCTTSVFMKIIRDHDAPLNGSDVTVVSSWPVTTLLLGAGSVIAIDCERRQVLGFLAAPVSAEQFIEQLVPIIFGVLRSAWNDGPRVHPGDSA